jgi:hypothetical protein
VKQQQLEQTVKDLMLENDKLKAEIKRAPTIVEVLGDEAFEVMIEEYPSFRHSGTPTNPTDAASEVLWSCFRMLLRTDARKQRLATSYVELSEDSVRMSKALAEYAMRAVEEDDA